MRFRQVVLCTCNAVCEVKEAVQEVCALVAFKGCMKFYEDYMLGLLSL